MPATTFNAAPDGSVAYSGGIVTFYILAPAASLPVATHSVPAVLILTPFVMAGISATDISTSFFLYVQFRGARTRPRLLLGCAYLYSGAMALLHLATIPNGVLQDRLIRNTQQSVALLFLCIKGLAAAALASAIVEAFALLRRRAKARTNRAIHVGTVLTVTATEAGVVASNTLTNRMPLRTAGSSSIPFTQAMDAAAFTLTISTIVVVLIFIRGISTIYLWLAVALAVMPCSKVLGFTEGGGYTLGWSCSRLGLLPSACILFLFFMRQFAGQQRPLSLPRDTLEHIADQRTTDLQKTIRQRDLLLREVYHRVKNNLQVVASLLAIERHRVHDPAPRIALAELRNRVSTLGLVHQQLMSSDDQETVSVAPFLQELTESVLESFGATTSGIKCIVAVDPVPVSLDFAIPLGLLTTELLTNVIKHDRATAVRVEFSRRDEGGAILIIDDNGNDFPPMNGATVASTATGNKIIEGSIKQLEGEMRVLHQAGVRVEIIMPMPEAA